MDLLLLKIEERTNRWEHLIGDFAQNPIEFVQYHILWIMVILVMLFLLTKLNAQLEEKGVDRAIIVSRGMVSAFTAFIVTPIAIVLFINVFAFINKYPMINLKGVLDCLLVTFTTLYWMAKCAFGGVNYMEQMYDGNSIVRLLWITGPITFVWLRTAHKPVWKLMILPVLFGFIMITRHRVAEPTFLTAYLKPHFVGWFDPPKKVILRTDTLAIKQITGKDFSHKKIMANSLSAHGKEMVSNVQSLYNQNNNQMVLILVGVIVVGLGVGYFLKKPLIGIAISGAAVGVFFVMRSSDMHDQSVQSDVYDRVKDREYYTQMFLHTADSLKGKPSIELSKIAFVIDSLLEKDQLKAPDTLCARYPQYFYKYCGGD